MSCRQSNIVTRSKPVPEKPVAGATSNRIRSATPARSARSRATSIDPSW
jgi:hypothetical protein